MLSITRTTGVYISQLVLVDNLKSGLEYAFHELPTGILGHRPDPFIEVEYVRDINEFETVWRRAGVLEFERDFIQQARDFTSLYVEYLACDPYPWGFPVFLQARGHSPRIEAPGRGTRRYFTPSMGSSEFWYSPPLISHRATRMAFGSAP